MVRRMLRGMTRMPFVAILSLALLALGVTVALQQRPASAANYSDPWWTLNSASPECLCDTCGCEGPAEWTEPGVSVRTGELRQYFPLFSTPGMVTPLEFGLLHRSTFSGRTQFGQGVIPTFFPTAQKVILDANNPNGNGGHKVVLRLGTGQVVEFLWGGSAYSTTACSFHSTLTKNGSGNSVLTDLHGAAWVFDTNGMPDTFTDRNGNVTDWTFNGSLQWTGLTDDRNQTCTIHSNAAGYVDYLDDPAGNRWTFAYDANDRLTTITTPTTPDQAYGITTTRVWDGSGRLTSVTDGRGNTPWTISYSGSSTTVSSASDGTNSISFSYTAGRTDVTDRAGTVTRHHYSGANVTKVEQWIGGQSKYATEYRWSGNDLVTIVKPRGNRIDLTRNGVGLVTERRMKTTDTASSSASDLVDTYAYTSHFLTSHTDPLGNTTTYGRDSAGNLTSISFPTVSNPVSQTSVSRSFTVNSYGQRSQATDEEGKVVTYEYYGSGASGGRFGLLRYVHVDPSGLNLTTEYDYDASFNPDTVTDPLGKVTTTTWDALRRRVEVEDAEGVETQWHYDGNGNVTSVDVENLDKDGASVAGNGWLTTSYTWTTHDRLSTITEEIGVSDTRTTSLYYDANGNQNRVVKPEGNEDRSTFNSRNLLATFTRGYGSGVASTVTNTYDDNGNLTGVEDGRGNDTTVDFDLFDRPTKTTNALGHYEERDYDKAGHVTEVRRYDATPSPDVLMARVTYDFDERGRNWRTSELRKDPSQSYSDAVTTVQRWKTGHVRYVTDPASKVTETQYDAAWRATKTIDAMGNELASTFDAAGRRTAWSVKEIDGGSSVTHEYEAVFDDVGRMVEKKEKDRTNGSNVLSTTYGYDSRGNLVWLVNAEGNPTRFTFDGVGRMTKKEVALAVGSPITTFTTAIVTEWGFDEDNRLTSFKDDAGNTSTWAYDAKDRPTTMTYPGGSQQVAYVYDAADNVTQTTDPAGNVVSDTFDVLNRRTGRSVSLASGFLGTTSESYGYDALNRMTSAEDNDYKVEFTHAVIGLRSMPYEETQRYTSGSAYSKTVTKGYDARGLLTSEAYPSGASLTLTRAYNDLGAQSSVTDGTNTIASWTYVGLRPKVVTFGNTTTQTNTWTGFRDEVSTVNHKNSGGTTLLRLDYGYDKVHTRTYERYGAPGYAGDGFAYDKAQRLTTAWMGSSTPANPSGAAYVTKLDFAMDDDGNRTSVVTTPYQQSPTTVSYTTNALNQYTAVGGASWTHDANGNVTNNGTWKFEYDYRNQIVRVKDASNNAVVATYRYDALGRRVEKDVSGGVFERYVYSGLETIAVYGPSDAWKQNFVFGRGVDDVLMLEQADVLDQDSDSDTSERTRSYYHKNALGSVMEITTASQTEAASYRYTPYGEVTITKGGSVQSSDPLGQHWGYTARFHDAETGLTYFRARYQDPVTGRFLQRDPVGYKADWSLYSYARARPVNLRDPRGLWPVDIVSAAITFCQELRARVQRAEADVADRKAALDKAKAAEDASSKAYDESIDDGKTMVELALRDLLEARMTPGEFGRAAEDNAEDLVKFARDMAEQDTQIAYGKFVAAEKDRLWAESALKDAQRNLDALRAQWAEFCGPLGDALARAWQDYAFDVLRRDWERERCRSGEGLRGRPPSLVPPPLPRDGFDLPPLPQPKSGDR